NRGTIGGSIAHADPTGEIPCSVLALNGRMVVRGPAGERTIPAEDLFLTYLTTALRRAELITEIRLPAQERQEGWGFEEITRRHSDFPTVEVAASAGTEGLRVVIGGVADKPLLVNNEALAPIRRHGATSTSIAVVALNVSEELSPETDVHASADHRRRLARVL